MIDRMSTPATEGRVPVDSLPHRLMLIRHEMGWSQREAAAACGITFGEWQSMESGRRARGLDDKVRKISAVTGYNAIWLMWGGPLGSTPDPGRPGKPNGGTQPPLAEVSRGRTFTRTAQRKHAITVKSTPAWSNTAVAA